VALRMSTEGEQARLDKQKKERAEAEETLPEIKEKMRQHKYR